VASYAAGTDRRDPLLSPLHANLHGLPPLQLLAAGNDLLVDDSLAFATRAARSGIAVDLRVWPDAGRLRRDTVPAMAGFIVSGLPGTSVPAARGPAPGIPAPRGLTRR
jgi:acetyl esterase/lipase